MTGIESGGCAGDRRNRVHRDEVGWASQDRRRRRGRAGEARSGCQQTECRPRTGGRERCELSDEVGDAAEIDSEGDIEHNRWPWATMKGQGQVIKLTTNKSLLGGAETDHHEGGSPGAIENVSYPSRRW